MLKSFLRRLRRDESGAVTVELVVMIPAIFSMIVGMTMIWDAFRAMNSHMKASYTIADALSRESTPIDASRLSDLAAIHAAMTSVAGDTSFRLTVIYGALVDGEDFGDPTIEWSKTSNSLMSPVTDIADIEAHIPLLAVGDQIMLIETTAGWEPMWNADTPTLVTFDEQIAIRPRFVQMCWEVCGDADSALGATVEGEDYEEDGV